MKSASLIRYDIARARRNIEAGIDRAGNSVKLAKAQIALPIAERRELKALAKVLTYKADIYAPGGRIFSCDGTWAVDAAGLLFIDRATGHARPIDPATLCDGHGRTITADSGY